MIHLPDFQTYSSELLREFITVSNPYEYLEELEWNDKLAVAVSLANVKNEGTITRLNLFCFDSFDHIYEYQLKILASKRFPFMIELNRFIEMVNEAGLTVKWLKGIQFESIYEKKPLFEYIEVKAEVIACFLVIMAAAYLFASFIIILEKIAFNENRMEHVKPLWKFIELMISPYRWFYVKFDCSWKFIRFQRIQ